MRMFLWLRAKCAYLWRIGLISKSTAFHWEIDKALGEYTGKKKEPKP